MEITRAPELTSSHAGGGRADTQGTEAMSLAHCGDRVQETLSAAPRRAEICPAAIVERVGGKSSYYYGSGPAGMARHARRMAMLVKARWYY